MARNIFGTNGVRAAAVAMVVASGMSGAGEAAFVGYSVVATAVTNSGQNLVRYELFANFNGPTDTVLNVFNFQASGGWAAHTDAANGFWHKDLSDSNSCCLLNQQIGTWAPSMVGSATLNRPFDSFLLIGGTPTSGNGVTADPSWNGGGANPNGWNMAQLPLYDELGWFYASPSPNLQNRVGTAPNTATTIKLGQFMLSANDTAFRTYTLRIAVNNASVWTPVFSDGSFTFPPLLTWFRDLDSDGFGAASSGLLLQSAQPTGYVLSNTDCNDSNAAINPNTVWHRDLDNDGFGAAADGTVTQCTQPAGYALNNTDNCPSIANPLQTDCNSNGIGDVCDIALGTSTDLNTNGIPDDCAGELIVGGSGFASIQAALAAAPQYATIFVGNGTYPPLDLSGKAVTVASIHGASKTIIDGGGSTRCVSMTTAATAATVLQGFTLANGRAEFGAGIFVSNASLNIRDCIIRENIASDSGGGIASIDSATVIVNTIIAFNQAQSGAGVFIQNTSTQSVVVVRDSSIDDNVSHFSGAGVQNVGRLSMQRVQLHRNIADGVSGGVWTALIATTELDDCVFCMNIPANIAGPYEEITPNVFSHDCDANGVCDADEITAGADDTNGNGHLDECELNRGDLNLDGIVNAGDLASLLNFWGATNPPTGDLDGDGVISAADLTIILGNWGTAP